MLCQLDVTGKDWVAAQGKYLFREEWRLTEFKGSDNE